MKVLINKKPIKVPCCKCGDTKTSGCCHHVELVMAPEEGMELMEDILDTINQNCTITEHGRQLPETIKLRLNNIN